MRARALRTRSPTDLSRSLILASSSPVDAIRPPKVTISLMAVQYNAQDFAVQWSTVFTCENLLVTRSTPRARRHCFLNVLEFDEIIHRPLDTHAHFGSPLCGIIHLRLGEGVLGHTGAPNADLFSETKAARTTRLFATLLIAAWKWKRRQWKGRKA